ncbi:hypothetical protein LPY66_18165 [Dehalobacter sp. DCM]|uniref:hypothetical protein n=1 Tax=Dehalobacter sp. DCM TaxID=2907827 RepID=UPI0030818497|nr:hypothetical protein LPY66_18165 [Dehalobacter sp. DCM]
MTIHELNLMINGYNEKAKEERKADIMAAFYSAYFSGLKKLSGSDLQKIYDAIDNPPKDEMTDEEMFNAAKRFAANFGGGD